MESVVDARLIAGWTRCRGARQQGPSLKKDGVSGTERQRLLGQRGAVAPAGLQVKWLSRP